MIEFLSVTKALSDESRVRLLMALAGGELCVCQLVELVGLAPSTVSKHMLILKQARLVEGRKCGRWIFYRLAKRNVPQISLSAQKWIGKSLRDDPTILRDRSRRAKILELDAEELCRKQSRRTVRKLPSTTGERPRQSDSLN